MRFPTALGVVLFSLLCGVTSVATAELVTTNPALPPGGTYRTAADVHATYNVLGNTVELRDIRHFGFTNIVRSPSGADEFENFDSLVSGNLFLNNAPFGPINLSGHVLTEVFNKVGNTTGTFDTELLALDLSGGPLMIRESPTLASNGQTSITDIGGGLFRINSFFDVFTELSLDGGLSFIPALGSARVTLVPEPAALGLAMTGIAALLVRRRRS